MSNSAFGTTDASDDTLMLMKQKSVVLSLVHCPSRRVITIWNGLPDEIVEETSDSSLSRKLDSYALGR